MTDNLRSKKQQIIFTVLVAGMCFIYPVFIMIVLDDGLFPHLWLVAILGSLYILTVLVSSVVAAAMGKIHMALPLVASFLAWQGIGLILSLLILFQI